METLEAPQAEYELDPSPLHLAHLNRDPGNRKGVKSLAEELLEATGQSPTTQLLSNIQLKPMTTQAKPTFKAKNGCMMNEQICEKIMSISLTPRADIPEDPRVESPQGEQPK